MRKFNFSYDENHDDLFLYRPKSKSKGSIEIGKNIVLDFNTKKELVGVQIMDATKFLVDVATNKESADLIEEVLHGLKQCKIDIKEKGRLMIIKIYLYGKMEEVSSVISVPSIFESSPALAYA